MTKKFYTEFREFLLEVVMNREVFSIEEAAQWFITQRLVDTLEALTFGQRKQLLDELGYHPEDPPDWFTGYCLRCTDDEDPVEFYRELLAAEHEVTERYTHVSTQPYALRVIHALLECWLEIQAIEDKDLLRS